MVLVAVAIGLGLLVTDVLLGADGISDADDGFVRDLVAERTPFLTDVSSVGSTLGGAPLLPILIAVVALACAALRRWRIAAFAAFLLVVESATYRLASLAVPRERPEVRRLEDLPADASFPSGHTAASVAVYAGLVLLLTSRLRGRGTRALAWAVAVAAAGVRRLLADVPGHAPPARRRRRPGHRHRRAARPPLRLPRGRGGRRGAQPTGGARDPRPAGAGMKVAVVGHAGKRLGGDGLPALRRALADAGVGDPLWYEVPKAKHAPDQVRAGARRGRGPRLRLGRRRHGAALPRRAGRHPMRRSPSSPPAPRTCSRRTSASRGTSRAPWRSGCTARGAGSTSGRFRKERFAVMAGAGFDAAMIRDADDLKERSAAPRTCGVARSTCARRPSPPRSRSTAPTWFEGSATCVLLGNLGDVFGGVDLFPDAEPDDGMLELGVVTAEGPAQWSRTLARTAFGDPERSPFVRTTKARTVKVRLDRKVRYELDGGDRSRVKAFRVKVEPGALSVCVPQERERS